MSVSLDQPPIYDPITKNNQYIGDNWSLYLTSLIETLSSYLGQYGMFIPNLTTVQRDMIQSPVNGQWIFNSTINAPQFYQSSSTSWRTVTFT